MFFSQEELDSIKIIDLLTGTSARKEVDKETREAISLVNKFCRQMSTILYLIKSFRDPDKWEFNFGLQCSIEEERSGLVFDSYDDLIFHMLVEAFKIRGRVNTKLLYDAPSEYDRFKRIFDRHTLRAFDLLEEFK